MNRMIKALAGESNAKKYAVYAVMVTAVLLVIALVVLVTTSIAYTLSDTGEEVPAGEGDGGEGVSASSGANISYTVVTKIDETKLGGALVSVQENRSEMSGGLYYGAYADVKLAMDAQEALDKMLVDFYGGNSSNLVTDKNSDKCTLPLLDNSTADGLSVEILVFNDDSTTYNVSAYKWIYENAYKYGFTYKEDTFTYVGSAATTYMNKNKITSYDNFISTLKSNGGKTVSVSVVDVETNKTVPYQMYYLAANGELKVPTNYDYFVIGNSTDGYVVTVNLSKKITVATTDTAAS